MLFHSDLLGAVILGWVPPFLGFYMLYVSCSNLRAHEAWLAVNRPRALSWTRYLVRALFCPEDTPKLGTTSSFICVLP